MVNTSGDNVFLTTDFYKKLSNTYILSFNKHKPEGKEATYL